MSAPMGNASDAGSRVPGYIAGTVLPLIVGTVFVLARCYTRSVLTGNWGVDDSWLVVAWVFGVVICSCNLSLLRWGAGHHQRTATLHDVVATLKIAFAIRVIYPVAIFALKMSLCTLYRRVFQDRKTKLVIYGLMGFITIYTLSVVIFTICQCNPPSDAWNITADGNCITNSEAISFGIVGILNVISDILLLTFVLFKIVPLKMATRQKVALLAVVGTSILCIIAAVLRTVIAIRFSNDPDLAWNSVQIATWTAVEIETGLFCVSVPTLKPLFRKVSPYLTETLSHSQSCSQKQTVASATKSGKDRCEPTQLGFEFNSHNSGDAQLVNTCSSGHIFGTKKLNDTEEMKSGEETAHTGIRKTLSIKVSNDLEETQEDNGSKIKNF